MTRYSVRYVLGPYEGRRTVYADDAAQAEAKVRAEVRRMTSLGPASESYRAVEWPELGTDAG